MTAFDTAIQVLFADPHMAVSGIYRAGGNGADVPLRLIVSQPDRRAEWNDVQFVVGTMRVDVLKSACPTPAAGDVFVFGGKTYEMQGQPEADELAQVWSLELVAQA